MIELHLEIPGKPIAKQNNIVFQLEFIGEPVAHQRPRLGRGGKTYTPQKTKEYKEGLAWIIKSEIRNYKIDKEALYGIQAIFYRSNRQRVDIDNLLKTVLDSLTLAGFWADDAQVREISARLLKSQKQARTEFVVYKISEEWAHVPSSKCQYCNGPISPKKTYPSSIRQFCSNECFNKSNRITITCRWCGKEFDIPRSQATRKSERYQYPTQFCSRECSIQYHRQLKRIAGKESDKWKCQTCGGRVSRKEYTICRACSMKTRSDPTSNYWKLRHKNQQLR